jgi:hypothetical protein
MGCMDRHFRSLRIAICAARMAGLSGGRAEGITLLEEAASPDADTEADALLILMIVHNREGRHARRKVSTGEELNRRE